MCLDLSWLSGGERRVQEKLYLGPTYFHRIKKGVKAEEVLGKSLDCMVRGRRSIRITCNQGEVDRWPRIGV